MANSWNINALSGDILNEQCFRYAYDRRNRMIIKKVPGAGEAWMVYDARDRIVMTQDANQRSTGQKKWLVTSYDALNRVVASYSLTDLTNYNNPVFHRQRADTSISYPNVASYTNELLTETHYDNYSGIPNDFTTGSLYASGYGTYLDAPAGENPEPLTLASSVKSLVTWTKTKVLGENKYIISCKLYDTKGRVVQSQTMNYTGVLDIVTNQYSFSGQVLRSHMKHQKGGTAPQTYELATRNIYDDLKRIIAVETNVNGAGYKRVSETSYDALGQMKKQKLAPYYNNDSGLDSLVYDYNIRGWMLGANRDYTKSTSAVNHFFGFDLGYDKTPVGALGSYTASQYNGNITGMVWKSKGDGEIRKYDFTYDAVNRLTGADFNQYISGFGKAAGVDFSVSNLVYDANGNILSQTQKGLKPTGSLVIDSLAYNYNANSNRLLNVIDAANDTSTILGDFRASKSYVTSLGGPKTNSTQDYGYDLNGNLVQDKNKDITGITYNYLNLPQTITVANKGSIDFVYDASGSKIKKVLHETGKPDKVTLYLFGIYENDTLQFLPQEQGRIRPLRDVNDSITSFAYDYFLKDHLGNVRVVLTDEQKQDVYPAATLEGNIANSADAIFIEKDYYKVEPLVNVVDKPMSWVQLYNNNGNPPYNPNPNSQTEAASEKVLRLFPDAASGGLAQLGSTIKVMAGDKVDVWCRSLYLSTSSPTTPYNIPIVDILAGMLGSPTGVTDGKGVTAQALNGVSDIYASLNTFLYGPNRGTATSTPRAFVNWILFDEQFRFVKGGFSRANGYIQHHNHAAMQNIEINKNGYFYVYVSNESPRLVWFDNLQVIHTRGPLLEETHYYPFGLTMGGISSKAIKNQYAENKLKYNGIEYESSFDINIGETFFRTHDPQIGRWWQMDPKPNDGLSLYAGMDNNPIKFSDYLGDTATNPNQNSKVVERNPKQDKLLTPGEIKKLKENGWDHSDKGRGGGKIDLYKDKQGNVYEKAKGNKGPGESTGMNLNDMDGEEEQPSNDKSTDNSVQQITQFDVGTSSKRPWWSPVELPWHPTSGMGGSSANPAVIEGQKAALNKIKKPAVAAGLTYVGIKVIEILIVAGSGGAAAPILVF